MFNFFQKNYNNNVIIHLKYSGNYRSPLGWLEEFASEPAGTHTPIILMSTSLVGTDHEYSRLEDPRVNASILTNAVEVFNLERVLF